MKLKLYNRDEIFLVNLDTVLYFKAEDHYTSVYYAKDTKPQIRNRPHKMTQRSKR